MRMRTLQKLALVSSLAAIGEQSVALFSRRDVIRTGLGWVGTWRGAIILIAATIAGIAGVDQLAQGRPDPRVLADPQGILEAGAGEIVQLALPLAFEGARPVTASKVSKSDFFLIPLADQALAGKVWVYRDNGITVGEGDSSIRSIAEEPAWLVVRNREGFPSGWPLPGDTITLDDDGAATRYHIPNPIDRTAIVLVPGAPDELRPSAGLFVWWLSIAGICCLLWASAAQRLVRTLRFLRDRKSFVSYLNQKLLPKRRPS